MKMPKILTMSNLIALIILAMPAYLLRFSVLGIPSTALEILIYLVFIFGLYKAKKIGFRKVPSEIFLPIGLLLIALIASVVVAPDKRVALGELKGFFIDPLLVFWLIFQYVKIEKIDKLYWAFAISALIVALHTITQKLLGNVTEDSRVIGIFGYNPNYVSLFLSPIAALLAGGSWIFAEKRNYRSFITSDLIFFLCIIAIYFSGSRGGLLALLGGLGAFAIYKYWSQIRERWSSQVIVAIVILLAIFTAWSLFKPNFAASSGRVTSSNNIRWQIWQTTFELGTQNSKNALLGVGLGNYQTAFRQLTTGRVNFDEYISPLAFTPHNLFLMFWLSTGILGVAAFLWLLYIFFKKLDRSNDLSGLLFATMISLILYGMIDTPYWKNDLSVIFWVIWGMAWLEKAEIRN